MSRKHFFTQLFCSLFPPRSASSQYMIFSFFFIQTVGGNTWGWKLTFAVHLTTYSFTLSLQEVGRPGGLVQVAIALGKPLKPQLCCSALSKTQSGQCPRFGQIWELSLTENLQIPVQTRGKKNLISYHERYNCQGIL